MTQTFPARVAGGTVIPLTEKKKARRREDEVIWDLFTEQLVGYPESKLRVKSGFWNHGEALSPGRQA